jgi:hypothetical protein
MSPSVARSTNASKVTIFVRGFWRFLKIVGGIGSEYSYEKAANYVLLAGFLVEYLIIREAVIQKGPIPGHLQMMMRILLTLLLIPLFFHQFLIFRNFSLPYKIAGKRDQGQVRRACEELLSVIASCDEAIETKRDKILSLVKTIDTSTDDLDAGVPDVARPDANRLTRYTWAKRKTILEITVYFLFSVLTGEAGYLLTIIRAHESSNVSSSAIHWIENAMTRQTYDEALQQFKKREVVQPGELQAAVPSSEAIMRADRDRWGTALEGLFILTASVVCFIVLLWDLVVMCTPSERKRYDRLIMYFFWNDVLSLVIWSCVLIIVTPLAPDLGYAAWVLLALFYLIYLILIGLRLWQGIVDLGRPDEYEEARLIKI